ncbi:putative RNA-binding protein EIF1AD [Aplochiton taeniatus]
MSQATKRKHVVKEALGDFVTPTENQQIVRVLSSRGNNLHEAVTGQGETFLVSMPTKFRKNLWIKRGDYVIVDPIEEGEKVKAEINFILYKDNIKYLQKLQLWPEEFGEELSTEEKRDGTQPKEGREEKRDGTQPKEGREEKNCDSEDDESDLFVNTNRTNYQYSESESESEEEDEDEEEVKGQTVTSS